MTPFKQLYKHDPDKGIWGDCHRTAIGCLLDIPPEQLPHFWQDKHDEPVYIIMQDINVYLHNIGYYLASFSVQSHSTEDILVWMKEMNPNLYYLLTGMSKNQVGHTVICCNDAIIHDPSLDDSGIIGPVDEDTFIIELLVPILHVLNNEV